MSIEIRVTWEEFDRMVSTSHARSVCVEWERANDVLGTERGCTIARELLAGRTPMLRPSK